MCNEELLCINGIDATTGNYLGMPMAYQEAAELIRGERRDPEETGFLHGLWGAISQPNYGLPWNVNAKDPLQAGWAVVFHESEDPEVKERVTRLYEHRLQQAGNDKIVKVLDYKDGERVPEWLGRRGVGAGTVTPKKVPYYLLLVGGPDKIPFSFGHILDVEYAVGRLHFDTVEGYETYVESVIEYEKPANAVPNAREAVFFATCHDLDPATRLSAYQLVNPLADGYVDDGERTEPIAGQCGFRTRKVWGAEATYDALRGILAPGAGATRPALLFTATHGLGWPVDDPEQQRRAQGALACADWPGPGIKPEPGQYLAAADLLPESRVGGLVIFMYACFGAGTPSHSRFWHRDGKPEPLAPEPFFAALPQQLLGHPNGGALACIGHVEQAWPQSIRPALAGRQLQPFENAAGYILTGVPVGYAIKDFNERYAAHSTRLAGLLEKQKAHPEEVSDTALVDDWLLRNDAEGYVVLGDPAVRLRVDDMQ